MQAENESTFHPTASVEVLIIGGGVIGSSIAYHVARQGRTALVVERSEVAPLRTLRRVSAWGGLQVQSIDDLPLIGSISEVEELALACGSWYGFALSPAIGRCMADHLAGLPTPELDQLSPQRITRFDPARVAAFLVEPET